MASRSRRRVSTLLWLLLSSWLLWQLAWLRGDDESLSLSSISDRLHSNDSAVDASQVAETRLPVWIVVDGLIFELQGGMPKGISVVWKNVLIELSQAIRTDDRLIFINRTPGSAITNEIIKSPRLESISYNQAGLEATVAPYIEALKQHPSGRLVFMSTYYSYPEAEAGLCRIMMYHDLIPERMGMNHGPGSEYYARIGILPHINSIVSVSHSTTADLLEYYGRDVRKRAGDMYFDDDRDTNVKTRNTIISTIPNRLSRSLYPGPVSVDRVNAFRKIANLPDIAQVTDTNAPNEQGYFLTVGSAYDYKNPVPLVKAIDIMSDDHLKRVTFVMVGRFGFTDAEKTAIVRHPVEVNGELQPLKGSEISTVPVRIRVIQFIDNYHLPAAYTGAIALLYLSGYEGFGLPVAEAMTQGTLVVGHRISSIPEVGGDAALYVDNAKDEQEVKRAIYAVMELSSSDRKKRINVGLKQVVQYGGGGPDGIKHGWNEMARLIYEHIHSRKHRGAECYRPLSSFYPGT